MSCLTSCRLLPLSRSYIPSVTLSVSPSSIFTTFQRYASHETRMNVILLQDIPHIGLKHEIKAVRKGYGRNYLIPNRLAIYCTDENQLRLNVGIGAWRPSDIGDNAAMAAEAEATTQAATALATRKYAEEYKKQLSNVHLNLVTFAAERQPDTLRTPITNKTIYTELTKRKGFIRLTLDNIFLHHPITRFGEYSVRVRIPTNLNETTVGSPTTASVAAPSTAGTVSTSTSSSSAPSAATGLGAIFQRSVELHGDNTDSKVNEAPVTDAMVTSSEQESEDMVTIPIKVLKYVPKNADEEVILAKPRAQKK